MLVVGAGVTGAGAALDAVTRGLRVGLVEARDYAAGTSSRSSKLFHGGLRYLEQLDFHLVFEALKERKLALEKLCPHLAKPVRFLYPLRKPAVDRAYAGLGIGVYDVMGAGRGVPSRLRHLSRKRTLELFPSADARGHPRLDRVLRGPGRRRPAHHDDRPDGRQLRRGRRHQYPGDRVPARPGPGDRRARSAIWRPAASSRSGPTSSSTRAGCGSTSSQQMVGGKRRVPGAGRRRASTCWSRGTGSRPPPG